MTKAQLKKLETIIAKLEALENEVAGSGVSDWLRDAKSALLHAHNEECRRVLAA